MLELGINETFSLLTFLLRSTEIKLWLRSGRDLALIIEIIHFIFFLAKTMPKLEGAFLLWPRDQNSQLLGMIFGNTINSIWYWCSDQVRIQNSQLILHNLFM